MSSSSSSEFISDCPLLFSLFIGVSLFTVLTIISLLFFPITYSLLVAITVSIFSIIFLLSFSSSLLLYAQHHRSTEQRPVETRKSYAFE